jgi:hypothetical protein
MRWRLLALIGLGAASAWAWQRSSDAQAPGADRSRFSFVVVESFDAQYLGDTPGHIGRGGSLGKARPRVSLGDPVFRGDTRVGKVSRVTWDKPKESLQIEFDPEPLQRVSVGDEVWVGLDGPPGPHRTR